MNVDVNVECEISCVWKVERGSVLVQSITNGIQLLAPRPAQILRGIFHKIIRFRALREPAQISLRDYRTRRVHVQWRPEGRSRGQKKRGTNPRASEI